jgi:hypothetical protein
VLVTNCNQSMNTLAGGFYTQTGGGGGAAFAQSATWSGLLVSSDARSFVGNSANSNTAYQVAFSTSTGALYWHITTNQTGATCDVYVFAETLS